MNKNNIIGFILIFAILAAFTWWMTPSDKDIAERAQREKQLQDSIKTVESSKATPVNTGISSSDSIKAAITSSSDSLAQPTISQAGSSQKFGEFSAVAVGQEKLITVSTEKYTMKVSTKGGFLNSAIIKGYTTFDSLPLELIYPENSKFNLLLNDMPVNSKDLYFEPVFKKGFNGQTDSISIKGDEKAVLGMRIYPNNADGTPNKDKFLEFEYTFSGNDYMLGFNLNMKSMSNIVAPGYNDILLQWSTDVFTKERDTEQERKQTTIYYKFKEEDVENISESKENEAEKLSTKVSWISFKQQFFSISIIAQDHFGKANITKMVDEDKKASDSKYVNTMNSEISIPLAGSDLENIKLNLYLGPNKYRVLNKYDYDLEQQIPLGWGFPLLHWINRFAVIPVFDFLSGFNWNYGIIILILTILLKIVLFPLTYKTYLSSAKMRVLKPEVDEISEKYPKKEDAMKKQQATMALYKKVGVNPMAGCVPMLIQMPILIAMFRFFPASIELRQQSFLWAVDLSSYDSIFSWEAHIPLLSDFYGNHISLFTLLMTVTTIFYTKINNQMMGSSAQQLPGMQTMMYLMPILFLGFFNNYSAGLSYYYFLANVITFAQMYLIRYTINENKIRLQLEENKKKPVKKSNFQKKLEDLAKQRGVDMKR